VKARSGPTATPFLFGDDLRQPAAARKAAADRGRLAEEQARAEIEREAFERGRAAGRAEAEAETARLQVTALDRIGAEAERALAALDGRAAAIEDEALAFFTALAETLAGRALAREPLGAVADAAREAFRHLRGVPHLVARVHESLVEAVDELLRGLSREQGFEGRIVVIGQEDIAPGDARLDWADGAVVAEREALRRAVDDVLARFGLDRSAEGRFS
jgi:flagellar assembly protein FliH